MLSFIKNILKFGINIIVKALARTLVRAYLIPLSHYRVMRAVHYSRGHRHVMRLSVHCRVTQF